jgi:hypothetical protein
MTIADWAIIILLASLALSVAGFVWNVWSNFIYPKARLRVGISNRIAIGGAGTARTVGSQTSLGGFACVSPI